MKIVFDLGQRQIGIEGDGPELIELLQLAREIAPSLSEIKILTDTRRAHSGEAQEQTTVATRDNGYREEIDSYENGTTDRTASLHGTTLRQFARSLQLANASERIAAIAYYQKFRGGRDSFSPKELAEWFTICGFKKPTQMPVALFDSRRKFGYTESLTRGIWKLTTNGENLIVGKLNKTSPD